MKQEELMVGDWYYWEAEGKKYPLQVTKETFALADEDIANFQAIPLTVEILEKNGFVANKHVYPYPYYEYMNEDGKLKVGFAFPQGNKTSYKEPWICIDSKYVFVEHLPCVFVHQLQHALRLCGIPKEIIL